MSNPHRFYAIDLFAGCGGLSEGFKQAGFDVIAQVEKDEWACETLRTRHLYHELKAIRKGYLYHRYVRQEISPETILGRYTRIRESIAHRVIQATLGNEERKCIVKKIELTKKFHSASKVHVLLGGPPCQPYSLIGRARDPFRMQNDDRHHLYKYYLKIVEYVQPDIFVYENVPSIFTAKAGGQRIFFRMLEDFSSLNPRYEITLPLERIYENPWNYILNSAYFHVPQSRKRLFIIGYRKSLVAKNPQIKEIFTRLKEQALKNSDKGCLTVDDAIGDLPRLNPGEGSDHWFGAYNSKPALKRYQVKMRKDSSGVCNHRARSHMKTDLQRYRFFLQDHRDGKGAATLNNLIEKRPDLIPQHRHLDKFVDRFRVQWWTRPSSTITAHICKDGHYYIHPDIKQCRSFTVREAARCQSFPDNFKFEGPRTEQFRQVGNAVPPLLAFAIARTIIRELNGIYSE